MQSKTDEDLVAAVKDGDTNAFNMLVSRYQYKIIQLVGRYVNNEAEREDVAQEAFIKAYKSIQRFRGDSAFYTWLYRIAVNTAKNHLVHTGRRPPAQDVDIDDAEFGQSSQRMMDQLTPEESLATDQTVAVIKSTIAKLPDELREAIMLREIDGLSYDEIADMMSCPVGTVRSRLFRAREAVDNALNAMAEVM